MILETLAKQLRMTDSVAAAGACQDAATFAGLEESCKPEVSLEGLHMQQRLLAPQNPKIGSIEFAKLIASTIIKEIEDSGFLEKLKAEYRSQ